MSTLNHALAQVSDQIRSAREQQAASARASARSTDAATNGTGDAATVTKNTSVNPPPSSTHTDTSDSIDTDEDDSAPIQVYCRIRPPRSKSSATAALLASASDDGVAGCALQIHPPTQPGPAAPPHATHQREQHTFRFTGLFPEQTTQEEIFESVGKKVIDNVLRGYNGTIFAYGQTGSGKTYTMMGDTQRYSDRGLIPRALTYLFDWITDHNTEYSVNVRISYLELYNDRAYDLLDPSHEGPSGTGEPKLENLPRVSLLEDEDGSLHFRNLGSFPASNVDEALNLLFVGDTNRVVTATVSNEASTRSHCIFIINLERRESGGTMGTVTRSRINLVDLAGSERVKKTGVGGRILNEALHINVSLHYLEQVIVALHQQAAGKATHIPYRNSMLTSVLRDSLGGNCKTVMIATLSPESAHLDESISTSRFAQRVAQIRNAARVNESIDPEVMVRILRGQVQQLKKELEAARAESEGKQNYAPLTESDREYLRSMVRVFLKDDRDPTFLPQPTDRIHMSNPYMVRGAFEEWKHVVLEEREKNAAKKQERNTEQTTESKFVPGTKSAADASDSIRQVLSPSSVDSNTAMQLESLQRDNVLLFSLLGEQFGGDERHVNALLEQARIRAGSSTHTASPSHNEASSKSSRHDQRQRQQHPSQPEASVNSAAVEPVPSRRRHKHDPRTDASTAHNSAHSSTTAAIDPVSPLPTPAPTPGPTHSQTDLAAAQKYRAESFEQFRRRYRKYELIESQKHDHSEKVRLARRAGEQVNDLRSRIQDIKKQIEQHRMKRGVEEMMSQEANDEEHDATSPPTAAATPRLEPDSIELALRLDLDKAKQSYRHHFNHLQELKKEIDYMRRMIEQARKEMSVEFERWWKEHTANQQQQQQQQTSSTNGNLAPSTMGSRSDGPIYDERHQAQSRGPSGRPPLKTAWHDVDAEETKHERDDDDDRRWKRDGRMSTQSQFNSSPRRPVSVSVSAGAPSSSEYGRQTSATSSLSHSLNPRTSEAVAFGTTRQAWGDADLSGSVVDGVPSRSTSNRGPMAIPAGPIVAGTNGLRTTGNASADADIARFYQLKQAMIQANRLKQQQQQ